ncbi:MAG: hypothetical protein ACQESG_08100 [Nanobdellota archaeon]
MLDLFLAVSFTIILVFFFVLVPAVLAYHLLRRRWMSERVRVFLGTSLLVNIVFVLFLVGAKLIM